MLANYIGFGVLLVFSAADNAAFQEVRTAVRASYQQREDLLLHSSGSAALRIEVHRSPEQLESFKQGFSKQFGFDQEKLRLQGGSEWTVKWYKSGDKLRYDMRVPVATEESKPFLVPTDMRIATDKEKGIYYDVLDEKAYINLPPSNAVNLVAMTKCFDVSRLYLFMNQSIANTFDKMLEYPGDIQVVPENVNGVDCIVVNYLSHRDDVGGGRAAVKTGRWVFAPSMGYSLLAADFKTERTYKGEPAGTSSAHYAATYVESSSFPGVWLIKSVRVEETGSHDTEILTADFDETRIGETIPDSVFSFEGMGVPTGTVLRDKRLPGQPIEYVYKAGQMVSLDNIYVEPDGSHLMQDIEPTADTKSENLPAEQITPSEPPKAQSFRWPLAVVPLLLILAVLGGSGIVLIQRLRK